MLVLRTIEAFKVFDIVYVMTGGGPANGTQTITFLTYLQAFSAQRFSVGAALAYLTVAGHPRAGDGLPETAAAERDEGGVR